MVCGFMFKKTNPQVELFGVDSQLSKGLRTRLKSSWANTFKVGVPSAAMPKSKKNKNRVDLFCLKPSSAVRVRRLFGGID
jgi:hypothetical protein